jgi:hypothetical protein
MRSQAASLAYTESPSNLLRPEWGYNPNVSIGPVQVLGNIPLGIHVAGLPLGVDVWLQGIGSLGPGTRIVQELDRVHEFGMRIGGSGPRFFIRQQDKLPTDPQGNFLVSKATPIVRLNVFAYLSANLSVFVPGAGWVDIPGMWPNLTADFTGTLDMPTGKVTWGAELSPALVSNWDPRDTILQNLAQALPDDVRKIINVARTTPDTPFDMSTIALVQGPALSLDWMVKWMEKPLTRFFEQRLGITPGTNAAPEPQVTVPPIAAPLPAGPPPTADNPITRELNRSTTELFDEIGDLHVQLEQIDQNLSRISADADAAVRAVEEQAAREIAAAHAAIDKWNATPPAPPGGPPKPPEPPPAPRGGPPGPSAPVPGSSAAGSSVDQVPMQDTAATPIPGSNDASLRLGSELHVVDAQGNPVPDWRARLRSEIAGYATGDFDSQETRLRLLGGHVTRGDGTRLDVRWTVGWRPRTHGTTILLDDVSVVPAAVKIIDGKMVVGRGLLGQVATGDIQLVDQRAVRRVLAEELRAAGYQNGWYHGIRNKTGRDVWIRLFGDGERPAGYDRTIPG